MVNANDFIGINDSEIINNAVKGRGKDGIVYIPPREKDSERDFWLLDSAILLPSNTTVILANCTLKLSDACRDNFFRTANCGLGIEEVSEVSNIHIKGIGECRLVGADNPRATGDAEKILANPCPHRKADILKYADWISEEARQSGSLSFGDMHSHSYGTDAGKQGESQLGDWRGIGVLFANTKNFSVENIKIVCSHGWGLSFEACCFGRIEKIDFDACMSKEIGGLVSNMENQDGVDIRNGCHHITISDITGNTGDDVVALTAVNKREDAPVVKAGSLCSTHVMDNDYSNRESGIHDIVIRNVMAYSYLCYLIRILPASTKMYNIIIDNVVDTSPDGVCPMGGIIIGSYGRYGDNLPDGLCNVSISNVITKRQFSILHFGYLCDSVISNITNRVEGGAAMAVRLSDGLSNCKLSNLCAKSEDVIKYGDIW